MTPAPVGPADESVFVRGLPPGQHESLLYVWTSDADQKDPDFLSVLDADPASSSYGKVIATAPTGSPANEGGAPGALVKLDNDGNFLEAHPAPDYMYDVGVKPELNLIVTSSWAHP